MKDGVHIRKHRRKAMSAERSLGSIDRFKRRTITQVPLKVPEATNWLSRKTQRSGGHQPLGL